jgi:hydrocephalus-inducing protein
VPFVFKLRVPGDDTGLVQEFKLEPSIRTIQPQETAMVNLTFTPAQAILYDTSLVLDIDHVGENMASIPIKAECIVPNVKIEPSHSLE